MASGILTVAWARAPPLQTVAAGRERRHQRVHQQDGGHHRAVSDGSARRAVSPIMDSAPSHKAKEGDGVVQ